MCALRNIKKDPGDADMIVEAWASYNAFWANAEKKKPTFFQGYDWRNWDTGGDRDAFMPAVILADAKRVLDDALAPLLAYLEPDTDDSRPDMVEDKLTFAMTQLGEFEARLNGCKGAHKEKAASERS